MLQANIVVLLMVVVVGLLWGGAQRFLGVLGSEVWIFLSCMCGGRQVQF